MKLHLGCGEKRLPGYIHIDVVESDGLDYCQDVTELFQISDGVIDEIYASHVLDHISRKRIDDTLDEWHRVLKQGGLLRVAVSDFEHVAIMYEEGMDLEALWGCIVGGHKNAYDWHGCVFDYHVLRRYLETHGFTDVQRYDWRDYLPPNYEDNSCAAIPKYDLAGYSMSLNVKCIKDVKE